MNMKPTGCKRVSEMLSPFPFFQVEQSQRPTSESSHAFFMCVLLLRSSKHVRWNPTQMEQKKIHQMGPETVRQQIKETKNKLQLAVVLLELTRYNILISKLCRTTFRACFAQPNSDNSQSWPSLTQKKKKCKSWSYGSLKVSGQAFLFLLFIIKCICLYNFTSSNLTTIEHPQPFSK